MERGLMMLVHSSIIGVIFYVIMVYALGIKPIVAEDRSILIFSILLSYMILFGHKLPVTINKHII